MAEAIQKKLELILTARDEATKVVDETVKRTKRSLEDVAGSGGGLGSLADQAKGLAEHLKSAFGRGSALNETLEILRGTGAIVGLSAIPEVLNEIKEAGAGIHEFFTHDQEYLQRMTEEARKTTGYVDARLALMEKEKMLAEDTANIWKRIHDERAKIGLSGDALAAVTRQQTGSASLAALEAERKKGRGGPAGDIEKLIADTSRELEELRSKPLELPFEAKLAGGDYGESQEQFQREAEARRAADEEKLNARLGSLAKERDRLKEYDAETEKQIAAARENVERNELQAKLQDDRTKEDAERAHQQRIADIRSETQQAAMRGLGDTLEADLEQIKRAADKEVQAIIDAGEKAKRTLPHAANPFGEGLSDPTIDAQTEELTRAIRERQAAQEEARRIRDAKSFSDLFPSLGAITGFLGGIGSKPGAPGPARNADLIDSRFLTGIAMATREGRANGPEEKTAENTGKTATGVADMARDISNLLSEVRAKAGGLLPF